MKKINQDLSKGTDTTDQNTLCRVGSLEVRLARSPRDIRRAQRLRYKVFYKELAAKPSASARLLRRDADAFDAICDHLLVLDYGTVTHKKRLLKKKPRIVGTYRLLRQDVAELYGGFYSQSEYNLAPLLEHHRKRKFLELGRSCVLKEFRNKRTVELLWRGIWVYVKRHKIDVMIGCASLTGTNPDEHRDVFQLLAQTAPAPDEWAVRALENQYVPLMPKEPKKIDEKQAMKELPPLIKGYLRLGCYIGDGAVVDHQFGTTDVFIVLPVENISKKYIDHYE